MIFVIVFIPLLIAIYYYCTTYSYWKKRNVKHDFPLPFFGNHFQNLFGMKSMTEISVELYTKYPKEKVVGYFRKTTPELIVKDLDIARRILTVDFAHFYARGLGRNPDVEPLHQNLFHADGDSWKLLRHRLMAAFTITKLKSMFPLVVRCAEKLQKAGEAIVSHGGDCDVRELMARFTTEFIGACGFGIEMDTINNEHSLFMKLGNLITHPPLKSFILNILWELCPPLRTFLYVSDYRIEEGMTQIVREVMRQRNNKPSDRNDFIDLLLKLKSCGKLKGDSIEKVNPDGTSMEVEKEIDLKCMVAQVFVFFIAGFETSSAATSYTLHELAFNLNLQGEIQEEIDKILVKHNKFSYDAISEMTLLSMAFSEAIRAFTPGGILYRKCTKKYTIPQLNVTIDPGVRVVIPIQAIQNDEKYFDNPTEFRPQRFSTETLKQQNKYSYMPFGEGPRTCIGARLGEMQSLAGLAAVLQKFTVEPAATTRRQLQIDHTRNLVQAVKQGLPLKLKLRKKKTM